MLLCQIVYVTKVRWTSETPVHPSHNVGATYHVYIEWSSLLSKNANGWMMTCQKSIVFSYWAHFAEHIALVKCSRAFVVCSYFMFSLHVGAGIQLIDYGDSGVSSRQEYPRIHCCETLCLYCRLTHCTSKCPTTSLHFSTVVTLCKGDAYSLINHVRDVIVAHKCTVQRNKMLEIHWLSLCLCNHTSAPPLPCLEILLRDRRGSETSHSLIFSGSYSTEQTRHSC